MPLAIGHFAVGATGALLVLLVTGLYRRTAQDGLVAMASGLWVMLPDVGVVLPAVGETDGTPLANLFWFHYYLDERGFTDSATGSALFVGLMVLTAAWLVLVEGNEE